MKIVIVGCGRVGASVAKQLSAEHDVTVVDWRPAAFDRLGPEFTGNTVVGNGIDADTLRQSGAAQADMFLALTDGDNRNLMMAQVAQHLGAARSAVRVYDPVRGEIFSQLGLLVTSPTILGAERLFDMVLAGEE